MLESNAWKIWKKFFFQIKSNIFFYRFPFIEPPSQESIEHSLLFLKEQGALDEKEELTSMGRMLADLPVDIQIGKMLIMASMYHVRK